MKKTLSMCVAAVVAGSLMTGCSLISKANGIILYGNESEIIKALEQEKGEFIDEHRYKIKVIEEEEGRMMVLSEETAQAIVEKELLRKVTKGRETEAMTSVAKLSKGEAIVYAETEPEKLNSDGISLKTIYGGNSVIGDGRAFVDKFLIVDDSDWVKIEGKAKSMAIMEYDEDPSIKLMDFDVDDSQLVKIGE